MGVVGFLARLQIRRRGWQLLMLALLAGIAGGIALPTAAGARRSSSSLDRFRRSSHAADVELAMGDPPTPSQLGQLQAILNGAGDVGALAGPVVRLHVVGIVRRPLDLSDRAVSGGFLVLPPAFAPSYADRIGVFGTYLRMRTNRGLDGVPKAIDA